MSDKYTVSLIFFTLVGITIGLACFADDDDDNDNEDHDSDQDNDYEDDDDSSSSADDDNGGDDDDDNDSADYCEEHQGDLWEPALFNATLMVNGIAVEMPATVHLSDTLALAIEYDDPDCDLWKAGITPEPNEPYNEEMLEIIQNPYLLPDIGCSSVIDGEPYYLPLETSHFYFPASIERINPLRLVLVDDCLNINDNDEIQYLDFTVVED
ncbi:MAG: hypothetical protein GX444_15525 [Myxococcales bacterium]|nr:hypothetical protein [Myxococcales bacterium]